MRDVNKKHSKQLAQVNSIRIAIKAIAFRGRLPKFEMKKHTAIVVLIFRFTFCAINGADISVAHAKAHIGERVTVRGEIVQIGFTTKGATFLNMGGRTPTPKLTVISYKIPLFALSSYEGKVVSVVGMLKIDNGTPTIVLDDIKQISVESRRKGSVN